MANTSPAGGTPEQSFLIDLCRWRVLGGPRPNLPSGDRSAEFMLLAASRQQLTYEAASFILEADVKGSPLIGICGTFLPRTGGGTS